MAKSRHPLAHLLGDGLMTGLVFYGLFRFVFRPMGHLVAHLSYRWRRVLAPLWFATGTELLALAWRHWAAPWWPLALVLPVLGTGAALAGPRLSGPASGAVLALVPDSVDAGRRGVLDRLPERVYLAALSTWLGVWLAVRVGTGASAVTEYGWLAGTAAFGGLWWYHRRIRRAGRADRYARRWRKLAAAGEINPKFKILRDSRVVDCMGVRRGICTLTVRLAHGAQAEDVAPILGNIASWYRLRRNAVTLAEDEDNSSRVHLRFLPSDPWRGKLVHPMPVPGSVTLAGLGSRLNLGVYATGKILIWLINHALLVGQTGSGKSVLLESILIWLTACRRDVVLVAADLASGATLGVWRRLLALPLAEDYDACVIMLTRVMAVIEDRERRLGLSKESDDDGDDSFDANPDIPWLVMVIDEYPDFVAEAANRKEGKGHLALLGRIAKRARKAKVRIILAAQNGSKADTGSKELTAQLRSLFGLKLDAHANRVFWRELVRQGWSSLGLKVGQFLLRDDEHTSPDVAKGYFVGVRERREHIRAAAELPNGLEPSAWAALTDTAEAVAGTIVDTPPEEVEAVLEQLRIHPGTAEELVERTGLSRATVFRRLRAHGAAGMAHSRGGVWHEGPAEREPVDA